MSKNFRDLLKVEVCWNNHVRTQVLILLPERLVQKHRIYDYQQFPHAGCDRNLMAFTCSNQALIEALNTWFSARQPAYEDKSLFSKTTQNK